jgi:predicted ArsR family transcriptional regulator
MSRGSLKLLEVISSNADLINSLRDGAKHPTEIAKEFDVTRMAIDKRLKKLKKNGLVEPKACVSETSDRPILKYELTEDCIKLLNSIDNGVNDFYIEKLRKLDLLLVTNKIGEEEYLIRRKELEGEIWKVKERLR